MFTDRASKSIDQLKYTLGAKDLTMQDEATTFEQLFPNSVHDENEDRAWQELQRSHAGLKPSVSKLYFSPVGFVLLIIYFVILL